MSTTDYAGFWLRLVAFIIDSIVLSVIYLLMIIPLFSFLMPANNIHMEEINPETHSQSIVQVENLISVHTFIELPQITLVVVALLYFTIMESSRYQSTVGKLALELKVIGTNERALPFSRALFRNIIKMISIFVFFVGAVMIAFTERKQGLHDLIAKTVVVKK